MISWVRSTLDLQRMYGSLTSLIMKQLQHKVHGMEIELGQAKNAAEQHGKGKRVQCMVSQCSCTYTSDIRIWKASVWLYYYWLHAKDVIVCITLYCLKGEACSPVL